MAAGSDRVVAWVGRIVSWLTLFMVLVTFLVVVLRYAFDVGWIAMQESVTYMHAALFMLGAAYTLQLDGHVRVDIFYQKRSPRGRAWVDIAGTLFLAMPVCAFILFISWGYVLDSWDVFEGSREAGGIPGIFVLKTLLLVMPILMLMQAVSILIRRVLFLADSATPSNEGTATDDPTGGAASPESQGPAR